MASDVTTRSLATLFVATESIATTRWPSLLLAAGAVVERGGAAHRKADIASSREKPWSSMVPNANTNTNRRQMASDVTTRSLATLFVATESIASTRRNNRQGRARMKLVFKAQRKTIVAL